MVGVLILDLDTRLPTTINIKDIQIILIVIVRYIIMNFVISKKL